MRDPRFDPINIVLDLCRVGLCTFGLGAFTLMAPRGSQRCCQQTPGACPVICTLANRSRHANHGCTHAAPKFCHENNLTLMMTISRVAACRLRCRRRTTHDRITKKGLREASTFWLPGLLSKEKTLKTDAVYPDCWPESCDRFKTPRLSVQSLPISSRTSSTIRTNPSPPLGP
jgi:hypothetical protein